MKNQGEPNQQSLLQLQLNNIKGNCTSQGGTRCSISTASFWTDTELEREKNKEEGGIFQLHFQQLSEDWYNYGQIGYFTCSCNKLGGRTENILKEDTGAIQDHLLVPKRDEGGCIAESID